jgi:hypothetical protein
MADAIDRFERWRRRQTARTADLAQRVLNELVPLYEAAEFARFKDYAGGDLLAVGANTIAVQRRFGSRWSTVEIQFHSKGRASFNIMFAELPEVCFRRTSGSFVAIDREQANVVEGDAYFSLCKGLKREFDCTFGVPLFSIFPDRVIDRDFSLAMNRSRFLIGLLNSGIPESWADTAPGYISEFVFKNGPMRFRKPALS